MSMKVIAKIKDLLYDDKTNAILSLTVENMRHGVMLKELDREKQYSIELKETRSKRSTEQNRYMWKLLSEIDKKVNGDRSNDEWNIYLLALEKAGAKYEYIACLPEAEDMIKENFRAVKFIKKIDLNGHDGNMYKCYIGSSKMDTKEMGTLINTVLDMAEMVGIDTVYWNEVLK